MPNINTLRRLARNPNYKMSPEEVRLLEEYREKERVEKIRQNSGQIVKHDTTVKKHDTDLPEEQRKGRG